MRGLYHVETLKRAFRSSVVNKFFWAFFSFGVFFALLYIFILATVFSHYYAEQGFKELLKMTICSLGIFFLFLVLFTYAMLRMIFRPFEDFFVWVKKSNFRNHINVPKQIPSELSRMYHLINSAVDDLHHANKMLVETEKNKVISVSVQMIAHEVRRPMTMLQTLLNLSHSQESLDEKLDIFGKYLPKVQESLDDSESLINNILSFGVGGELKITECFLKKLVISVLDAFFISLETKKIFFEFDLDPDIIVSVDPSKIKLVLKNIISNAYEEMPPGNTIKFFSKKIELNQIELLIFNTGSYLDEELRHKIFDIYYTTKKKGNGIGLALSRKIVRDHGGEIICKSFKNYGTCFYISLPAGKSVYF